jgi:hypothetical protein
VGRPIFIAKAANAALRGGLAADSSNLVLAHRLATGLVAAEWLNEGLYKKVLGGDPRHADIVGSVPVLSPSQAAALLKGLGLLETAIAVWVFSGRKPIRCAQLQTLLVTGMNTGGLVFGGEYIENHRRLVIRSTVFVGLVWLAAMTSPHFKTNS